MSASDPNVIRRFGLLLGAVLAVGMLAWAPPAGLSVEGWRTAAVAVLMAVWWMTEAIPIPATAMLPLVLFPALGVLEMGAASAPYANPLIFLFMGGFVLALGMERWGLHKRLALGIMGSMGTGSGRVIFGFMLAAAFLSMWISNTAAAAMMLPIGLAVIALLRPASLAPPPGGQFNFGIALMLGIAYGSSIGGVATLIGTPPNAILAAAADELLGVRIGFFEWMWIGIPLALLLLPITWFLLVRVLFPLGEMREGGAHVLREERAQLGRWTRGEVTVACVFVLTALAWVFREEKVMGAITIPGIERLFPAIGDATIAMIGALALFLIPVNWREGQFALRWEDTSRLPWGVLLLFGGGLSLARAMDATGLALWIGTLVEGFQGFPVLGVLLVLAVVFVFLTELTSNTATATMAMPILVAIGLGMGIDPILLMSVAALSSSMAFMLPVATPPNAIVFASEDVTIPRMMRAGLVLNLIAIALVTLAGPALIVRILGGLAP